MNDAVQRERAQLSAVNESYSACKQQLGAALEDLKRTQQRLQDTEVCYYTK